MTATLKKKRGPACLVLAAETAADLMTPNPISIRANASIKEAVALLTDKGFSAAPVIDHGGRPVGVVSRTDILIHDREKVEYATRAGAYYEKADLTTPAGEPLPEGFEVEDVDRTPVRDIMTPAILSVTPHTPAAKVVEEMLMLRVHRLFVVDPDGILVGVVSALDILKRLRP